MLNRERKERLAIEVREVGEHEWEKLRKIRLAALENDPAAFGTSYEKEHKKTEEDWRSQIRKAAEHPESSKLFVAEKGPEFVGMLGAFSREPGVWVLYAMYVSAETRGQGVGQKLMSAMLERIAEEPQARRVDLYVNVEQSSAVALYERSGFVIAETEKDVMMGDGQLHDEYRMEKILASKTGE